MSSEGRSGLLVLPGHAIYHEGKWHGGERGGTPEELARVFAGHVAEACRVYGQENYAILCVSGGRSRPNDPTVVNISEAEGLAAYIKEHQAELQAQRVELLVEPWARDSFENVFFSLLAYYEELRAWPQRVGVVSWKYKVLRFSVAAVGLAIADRFAFYGSGDARGSAVMEIIQREAQNFAQIVVNGKVVDPLHRSLWFREKRQQRTPDGLDNAAYLERVMAHYQSSGLIRAVEERQAGNWWTTWPWC